MEISNLDFSRLLKEARAKKGVTFEETGRGISCSPSYVYRLEKGDRKMPSYSFVQNVINYFELTENDLIKYQIGVSEEYTYKAKINEEIKGINVDSYKEINHLLKMIKYYQEVMQNHNRKG